MIGMVPGERGDVALAGDLDGTPYGVPTALERAHPARREPACAALARCMRCALMPFDDPLQHQVRARLVARLVDRVSRDAGVALPEPRWIRPEFPARWARRVRYRYRVGDDGEATVGFYRPDRVTLEGLTDCAVAHSPLGDLLPHLRDALGEFPIGGAGQVVAAVDDGPAPDEAVVCVRAEDGHFPDPDWCARLAARDWPVRGVRLVDREGRERFRHGDPTYLPVRPDPDGAPTPARATAGLPIEDGPEVLAALRSVVRDLLAAEPAPRILECFAGVGTLTTELAAVAEVVHAVTTPADAVDDLHRTFAGVPTEEVMRAYASLARGLAYAFRKPDRYDLVCAWAPGRGAVGLWRTIADTAAPRLITSHGDLEDAARDLRAICKIGYRPRSLVAIPSEPERARVTLVIDWIRAA